jgi:hypothetical protein
MTQSKRDDNYDPVKIRNIQKHAARTRRRQEKRKQKQAAKKQNVQDDGKRSKTKHPEEYSPHTSTSGESKQKKRKGSKKDARVLNKKRKRSALQIVRFQR